MNARSFACGAAYFILAAIAAVQVTDASRAHAQEASPPRAAGVPWSSDRPPGVPSNRWIPISGAFGIVIVSPGSPLTVLPGRVAPQPLEGYFAVYDSGRWWRLLTDVGTLTPLARAGVALAGTRQVVVPRQD